MRRVKKGLKFGGGVLSGCSVAEIGGLSSGFGLGRGEGRKGGGGRKGCEESCEDMFAS